MCCPFADATSFASGWLLVSTFYNQFLDSDQPSDSIACKRRPGHVLLTISFWVLTRRLTALHVEDALAMCLTCT